MDVSKFKLNVSATSHKWNVLRDLWTTYGAKSITFTQEIEGWFIREYLDGELSFQLRRDVVNLNRYTDQDNYGLLGVSLLDLNDPTVIITEGVSDYISVKLNNPTRNVLGITTLGGNTIAKTIIVSLFESVMIVADSDQAGLQAGMKWRRFLSSYGIRTKLWQPTESRFKDYTDEFIFNLKLEYGVR